MRMRRWLDRLAQETRRRSACSPNAIATAFAESAPGCSTTARLPKAWRRGCVSDWPPGRRHFTAAAAPPSGLTGWSPTWPLTPCGAMASWSQASGITPRQAPWRTTVVRVLQEALRHAEVGNGQEYPRPPCCGACTRCAGNWALWQRVMVKVS